MRERQDCSSLCCATGAISLARLSKMKGRASLKKIAMGAGPFKPHMIFFEGIDQDPIRLKVAVPAARELSSQWMIFQFRRQRLCIDQQIENPFQLPQVFPRRSIRRTSFLNCELRLKLLTSRDRRKVPSLSRSLARLCRPCFHAEFSPSARWAFRPETSVSRHPARHSAPERARPRIFR